MAEGDGEAGSSRRIINHGVTESNHGDFTEKSLVGC